MEYLRNMSTGEIYKREKYSEGKLKSIRGTNYEVRHPRFVGSVTIFLNVLHIQSKTTIFHLAVQ